jgi:hypothetical protein
MASSIPGPTSRRRNTKSAGVRSWRRAGPASSHSKINGYRPRQLLLSGAETSKAPSPAPEPLEMVENLEQRSTYEELDDDRALRLLELEMAVYAAGRRDPERAASDEWESE